METRLVHEAMTRRASRLSSNLDLSVQRVANTTLYCAGNFDQHREFDQTFGTTTYMKNSNITYSC